MRMIVVSLVTFSSSINLNDNKLCNNQEKNTKTQTAATFSEYFWSSKSQVKGPLDQNRPK